MISKLLSEGWVIVTEFDDHPDHFGMLDAEDQLAFRGVHAVQVSTPALAAVLQTRDPEIAVFPNTIRALPELRNFLDPQILTLFFGALNRERDWAPLMPVLNEVAQKAGDRLRFSVVHDRAFFDALHTSHKRFTPTCDHENYMTLLGQCEISLMPLADTPFNRAKSDLKFIEAGACRVATVASHIMYSDSVEDGSTGLLFHDADELRDRLLRLVAMPELARALGDAARQYVAGERMLAYQVSQRIYRRSSMSRRRAAQTNPVPLHRMRQSPDGPRHNGEGRAGGTLLVVGAQRRQRHHARRLGLRVHHAVQAVDHIRRGDRLAVVPPGLWIEVEGISPAVLAEFPACRQVAPDVRLILGLGVVLDELIVDPRITDDLDCVRAVGMPVGRWERVGMHANDAAVRGRGSGLGLRIGGIGAHQCAGRSSAQRCTQHQPSRRMGHRRTLPVQTVGLVVLRRRGVAEARQLRVCKYSYLIRSGKVNPEETRTLRPVRLAFSRV